MNDAAPRRGGGRPTADAAAMLDTRILDAATAAFLAKGYAATTIESVAKSCGAAKRTIYARWSGKPALFRAVLDRLMTRWLATAGHWVDNGDLETALNDAAQHILAVALTQEAVALTRLLIAESARFPELPDMMRQAGAGEGAVRIAALLNRAVARGSLRQHDTAFAAEQFLHLLLAGPQRRAFGLGKPLDEMQLQVWRRATISLFLGGLRS